jgi:hypothetical protein
MPNTERMWSDYQYEVSGRQLEALLAIALKKDQPLESLLAQALDEFIDANKSGDH